MTSVADTAFDENGAQIGVVFETATPFDTPNWQPWLVFFLRSLAEQVRRLNQKIEREKLVLAPLPELSLQVVEFAREHGRVTMGDVIRLTGASRNTLKQHFRALVEQGHLNQHGSGRGVWYELL
jgi:predicted HTH transcriptional regulator